MLIVVQALVFFSVSSSLLLLQIKHDGLHVLSHFVSLQPQRKITSDDIFVYICYFQIRVNQFGVLVIGQSEVTKKDSIKDNKITILNNDISSKWQGKIICIFHVRKCCASIQWSLISNAVHTTAHLWTNVSINHLISNQQYPIQSTSNVIFWKYFRNRVNVPELATVSMSLCIIVDKRDSTVS